LQEPWLRIFDVRTGRIMAGVDGHVVDNSWPIIRYFLEFPLNRILNTFIDITSLFFLRWAGGKDDKYFATLIKNTVSVYETKTFRLLRKKARL